MYYISRYIGQDRFGVVDSDTGRETQVLYGDIEIAYSRNYEIEGVILDPEMRHLNGTPCIDSVEPWVGLQAKSALATKLKMLQGIDVYVYDGYISNIRWLPKNLVSPVSIRLSDFGEAVADRFLYWGDTLQEGHCLTLVFDDKVRVLPFSFQVPRFYSMESDCIYTCIDIREVTDECIVRDIYVTLYEYLVGRMSSKHITLLDIDERYKRMMYRYEEYM